MMTRTVKAEYLEQVLPEYQDNPLIEALPDIMSGEETLFCLTRTPTYSKGERNLEAKYRIHCLSRLLHDYYQPLPQHLDIETRISVCLRQGYRNRNPLERQYALMVNESYAAMREKRPVRQIPGYHPNASGFTIIGVSGVGKSTAVESILYQYPQVIEHTEYKSTPLPATQIVWLKLDTPHDGSRGELCYRFFKAVDDAVGSEYLDQYKRSRITIDSMLTLMQRIAQEYSLGLLVVDEVQHLSLAKGGSDAMLNFFVTLVNTIGVPVIMIGTSKAMPLLQGQFRQARRSSGHGDLIWNRLKRKERNWITFVESIWKYQWIRNEVRLTPEMLDAVYEETQGIIVLAVVLYVLLQEDAILSERETFGVEDIGRVARERMALVQPMLKALRENNQKEIDKYEDITDILITAFGATKYTYKRIGTKAKKWITVKENKYNNNSSRVNMYTAKVKSTGYLTIKWKSKDNGGLEVHKSITGYSKNESLICSIAKGESINLAVDPGTYYLTAKYSSNVPGIAGKFRYTFTKVKPTANYSPGTAIPLKAGKTVTICMTPQYNYSRWYRIQVTKRQGLTYWVTTGPGGEKVENPGYCVDIYDDELNNISTKQAGSGSKKYFSDDYIEPGIYYIQVSSDDGYDYYITRRLCTLKWK